LCSAVACGDDDDSGKKGNDAGLLRDGGTKGGAGNDGSGGTSIGPQEQGDEGWPCMFKDGDCNKGFTCVENIFADQTGKPIGVCARHCQPDMMPSDCEDGEECFSYTNKDADAHCVSLVTDEYGVCGVGDTSVCDKKRSCLYFPNSPFGVCVDICSVSGGAGDAGADEDGGAVAQQPAGSPTTMCTATGETCVDGVLSEPQSGEGVCGFLVDRGAECGLDVGKYCNSGDICAPEDPNDLMNSTPRCFENCSDTGTCKKGNCIVVQGSFAYCM
jgi:hypothetical protein